MTVAAGTSSCLTSLRFHLDIKRRDASEIAARPAQAIDNARRDGIERSRKDDGDGRGRRLGGQNGGRICDNHCHLPASQLLGKRRQPLIFPIRPAVFHDKIATFNKACFIQALVEGAHELLILIPRFAVEKPDRRHRRLLRVRPERRRHRHAAEQPDDLSSPHWLTSKPRAATYHIQQT
jgi:hypothetical protein